MSAALHRFGKKVLTLGVFAIFVLGASVCPAQEPALPEGMETDKEQSSGAGPALPSGLDEKTEKGASDAPGLPPGLGGESEATEQTPSDKTRKWQMPEAISGFLEARGGLRVHEDPVHDDVSLAETRLQLSYDKSLSAYIPRGRFRTTGDLLFDATVSDHDDADLEKGTGFFDLREFWVSFTPVNAVDMRAGRQVLTWGTGNLVFLNDLFPKDYQSFFLGRDLKYLKAPSDALKTSIYGNFANVDIVYTPRFDSDRFVDGSRLSFYDPSLGGRRGEDNPMDTWRPDDWFEDDEIAVRLYRNIGAYELAAYGYHGFWKGPSGRDPATGQRIFPELNVIGASLRGTLGPGIANTEFAWYRSEDDEHGDDPFVKNSQMRFLAGYEQEVATDLTMGVQYYVEYMMDYDAYEDSLAIFPPDFPKKDRALQWLTLDLTRELMAQNQLVLSLFTFYSLSENEFYFRPKATYDYTDNWKLQTGANIFMGERTDFFGRFEESSNVYASVRYGF